VPHPVEEAIPWAQVIGIEPRGSECREDSQQVGEHGDEHEPEPVPGKGDERRAEDREGRVETRPGLRGLEGADQEAQTIAQEQ
jgi:hypothetical protein